MLEEAGLARGFRAGRERMWKLRARRLLQVQLYLDQISRQWNAAIGRLKVFVQEKEG